MAVCPAGHQTQQADYCDVCGLPVASGPQVHPLIPAASTAQACPHCASANAPGALFCEACGYDYTTGTMPRGSNVTPAEATVPDPHSLAAGALFPSTPGAAVIPGVTGEPAPPSRRGKTVSGPDWVAEVWIDPDWYATQGSPDPLPSPGLPDVIPLRGQTALIGRLSISRKIEPDIDCELDTGCSRKHAQLSTDGSRWWIEDLDSANGTFIGTASGPLPAMPIPRGRVEITAGQRIYVGAWTRIVIRRATPDEQQAFAL